MGSVTRVRVRKCGAYDYLLDVKCNQPKNHDDNHRYSEGPDLQFSWSDAEKEIVNVEDYGDYPLTAESW